MRFEKETLEKTIPFEANAQKSIPLEEAGFCSRIDLLVKLNITAGTAVTPAEDALAKIIKQLVLKSNYNTYVQLLSPDLRPLYFMNKYDFKDRLREDSLPSAGNTADVYIMYRLHFGYIKNFAFDVSALVPLEENGLELAVTWGSASDLGSGYTINSGEITVTLYKVIPENASERSKIAPRNRIVAPFLTTFEKRFEAAKSDTRVNVPTGYVERRLLLMTVSDDYATRTKAWSKYGVVLPKKADAKPIQLTYEQAQNADLVDYNLKSVYEGVVMHDWKDLTGEATGINLINVEEGDIQLFFDVISAPSRLIALRDDYQVITISKA